MSDEDDIARAKKILEEGPLFGQNPNADNDNDDTIDKSTLFGEKYHQRTRSDTEAEKDARSKKLLEEDTIFDRKYEQRPTEPINDGSEAYYRYHNWTPTGAKNFIDNINQFYAFNVNSKSPIMHFNSDGTFEFVSKGNFLGEFAAFNYEYNVPSPNDPSTTIAKKVNMGVGWYNHSRRRNHKHIVMDPSRFYNINDERYNLWQGYDLKPKKGDWSRFGSFVKDIICSRNEADYQFQLGGIAHLLRHPEKKLQFASVLQGDKGIGKTFYAKRITELIGPKYSKILSQREKFFNRFNVHLAKMLFVCLDEAFYVGNRNEAAQLKGFITGDTIDVEYKHGPIITVPNLCYLMLIGNPRHIVEATERERRYHCLTPSEGQIQNSGYFGELKELWDSHERDAFAHYALYEHDLSGVNMYKVPNTIGLMRQKLHSFDARDAEGKVKKWLYHNILMDAVLPYNDNVTLDRKGVPEKVEDGKEPDGGARVVKDKLYQICAKQCHIEPSDLSKEEFGRILYAAFPDGAGGSIIKQGRAKGARNEKRDNVHIFPGLLVARQSFAHGMGGEIEWNEFTEWDKMQADGF